MKESCRCCFLVSDKPKVSGLKFRGLFRLLSPFSQCETSIDIRNPVVWFSACASPVSPFPKMILLKPCSVFVNPWGFINKAG